MWERGTGATYQVTGILAISILHHAYPVCAFFEDRYPVPGSRFRIPGTQDPGPINAEDRTPSTEDRA